MTQTLKTQQPAFSIEFASFTENFYASQGNSCLFTGKLSGIDVVGRIDADHEGPMIRFFDKNHKEIGIGYLTMLSNKPKRPTLEVIVNDKSFAARLLKDLDINQYNAILKAIDLCEQTLARARTLVSAKSKPSHGVLLVNGPNEKFRFNASLNGDDVSMSVDSNGKAVYRKDIKAQQVENLAIETETFLRSIDVIRRVGI